MKLRKRLQNPFVLAAQGFVLGGLIFFASHSESLQARAGETAAGLPAAATSQPSS